MPQVARKSRPDEADVIKNALRTAGFTNAAAYRYNSVSLRVRIIDPRFRGLSAIEREKMVLPHIEGLPKKIRDDITILLLLAPEETSTSMMSLEFDDPTPSRL
jgi:stress-induced morphogen